MILFFSDGRLGNQFFQYSFLNTISKSNETILVSNMDEIQRNCNIPNKNFKNITLNKYTSFIIREFVKPFFLMSLVKIKLIGYISQKRLNDSAQPTFLSIEGLLPIRLVETDFFQSEKMFSPAKADFSLKQIYLNKAETIFSTFPKGIPKVFIHVRRGDYLNQVYRGNRGINLPQSYYINAINHIENNTEECFYVFVTDDYGYVECCFDKIKNKFISSEDMATDLALMAMCDYGIVSNSSFSWWGAYLMENPREVVFPKYWYGWKVKQESHIDIQPEWGTVIDFE
jgi:hypothetical protein